MAALTGRGLRAASGAGQLDRRRALTDRRTVGLGILALSTAGAVAAGELARVWQRGSAPLPAEADDVFEAGAEATRQAVEVAVEGYRASPRRESALLNVLASFTLTFAFVRISTARIRARGRAGPFRNLRVGGRHIHHFVPGIVLAFLAGGASVVSRSERWDAWLAVPFGAGMALTLDESALLLELEDVYWTPEGLVSVQIALATLAGLSSLALALRLLRRGEARVLDETVPVTGAVVDATGVTRAETSD